MRRRYSELTGRTVAVALLTMAPLLACAGGPSTPPPKGVGMTTSVDVTAGLVEHHRYHHRGGITLLVAMSLDTLSVSAEQQPGIDRVRAELHAVMVSGRGAEAALLRALADGVGAGRVERDVVDAALAKVGEESAMVFAASATALNELHGLLTPAQRAALFDKVAWHWAIWQSANGHDDQADDWVAKTEDSLGLTTDQSAQVRAALEARTRSGAALDPNEVTGSLRALAAAFQAPDFDARGQTTGGVANGHMATFSAQRMAYLVEAATPVLDADQKVLLQTSLRERARQSAAPDPA